MSVTRTTMIALAALAALQTAVPVVAQAPPPPGFVQLFNGKDFTGWKVPEVDNGHWKIVDGVIDDDAQSEATVDKNLWTAGEYGDFVLSLEWRIKETPYVNPGVPIIRVDGSHKSAPHRSDLFSCKPRSRSPLAA